LLVIDLIKHIEEATWLSPIVIGLKKNKKLEIYVDFKKFNVIIKKDPCPL
jgi:hypothetical protein